MTSRLTATVAIVALVLAACGGDDGGNGNGNGGDSPQDQVADMMMDALNESMAAEEMEGVTVDEDCVRDKVGELEDEDAELILEAGADADTEPEGLSESAREIGTSILECVDVDL
jgi:hypothetical protein